MAKLTTKQRKSLPKSDFALAGRRYPVEDKSHARNALSRVSQHGTPSEKAAVRAKVHSKFPSIGGSSMKEHMHNAVHHPGHPAHTKMQAHKAGKHTGGPGEHHALGKHQGDKFGLRSGHDIAMKHHNIKNEDGHREKMEHI